jgi:hypothetical protein
MNHRQIIGWLPVLLVILAAAVFAADPERMTVERLLDLQNRAVDAKGVLRKATSFMMKQRLEVIGTSGIRGEVVQTFKSPGRWKSVTYLNDKLFSTKIFNGSEGWTLPVTGGIVPTTGPELELQKIIVAMSNPAKNMVDIFRKIDLDEAVVDGESYYRLTCHPESATLDPIILYIDKDDFLNKRLEMQMWNDGRKIAYSARNLKYADIGGVKVVEVTEATVLGIVQRFTLEDYRLDVDVADSEFELTGPYRKTD